jgi:uncharacterized protein YqjF (DUF2071 family)
MWVFRFHEEPGIIILIYLKVGYMINMARYLTLPYTWANARIVKYLSEHLKYNPNRKKSSKNILDTRLAN